MAARLAITGASGFIGRTLVPTARAAGFDTAPLSRNEGLASYEDEAALARAFAGCTAVVHLAARAHRRGDDGDFECNVRAARAAAGAARAVGVRRFVLVSSIGVNGNTTAGRPFTEGDAPAPAEPYARSKLRAEIAVREVLAGSRTEWAIVRPPLVYGPRAPGNFGRLVAAVERGWPLPLRAVANARSLLGVENLAGLLLACATHPAAANELFLACDGDDLSTPDIVRCIARGLGREATLWPAPPQLLKLGARLAGRARLGESLCDSLQVDASRARRVLGWSPALSSRRGIEQAAARWRPAP